MVQVSMITRTPKDLQRETKNDLYKVHYTIDPLVHQMRPAREFQRAIVAAKIQKIFAKPFLAALSVHVSAVTTLVKSLVQPETFLSGSEDGEIVLWDLVKRQPNVRIQAFENPVRSIAIDTEKKLFAACGEDWYINLYDTTNGASKAQFHSTININSIEFCRKRAWLIAAGERGEIWDIEKEAVIDRFVWGNDAVSRARFSPVETDLLLCSGVDRGLFLYDCRQHTSLAKVSLLNKSTCLCWNPMEPANFAVGNDDGNAYGFDLRRLEQPLIIYKDHIGAVVDIDFAPTGRRLVTASFDRTIRLFDHRCGKSEEVYHARRMQKVLAAQWTADNKYILTGSEDGNVRLWKSVKHEPCVERSEREQRSVLYRNTLVKKYERTKPIRQISKTHLPKYILNARRKKQIMKESQFRKRENQRVFNEEVYEEPLPEKLIKVAKFEE